MLADGEALPTRSLTSWIPARSSGSPIATGRIRRAMTPPACGELIVAIKGRSGLPAISPPPSTRKASAVWIDIPKIRQNGEPESTPSEKPKTAVSERIRHPEVPTVDTQSAGNDRVRNSTNEYTRRAA
jgi:hypothetical protein